MRSDPQRLAQVLHHLQVIKAGDYPAILGSAGDYRILERPWQELAEPSKLAILTDAIDWQGISNRDRAHILLANIDPGQITDAQRRQLIDQAAAPAPAEIGDRLAALRRQLHGEERTTRRDEQDRGR